jgi:hypothetical protein
MYSHTIFSSRLISKNLPHSPEQTRVLPFGRRCALEIFPEWKLVFCGAVYTHAASAGPKAAPAS